MKYIKVVFLSVFLLIFVSCGGEKDQSDNTADQNTVEFNLTGNDQMKFNLKAIVAKEGDNIVVNFENIGRMPKETMGHNFVVLKAGVDIADFATKAMKAKDNDYIPIDEKENIIVASKLLGPGEKEVIKFSAPEKGVYKFVCTFPGHYMTMQGNLIVR